MTAGLELVGVRKGRGRVHLSPARSADGPVHTLCGKQLAGAAITGDGADCQACLRRRDDPAVLSSAFFNQDEGSRLLELSLAAAERRRQGRPNLRVVDAPAPGPRAERPARPPGPSTRAPRTPPAAAEPPAPPRLQRRGELDLEGMRRASADVYRSPGGVIVRLEGERIVEVVGGTTAQLLRTERGLRFRIGDLLVDEQGGRIEGRWER